MLVSAHAPLGDQSHSTDRYGHCILTPSPAPMSGRRERSRRERAAGSDGRRAACLHGPEPYSCGRCAMAATGKIRVAVNGCKLKLSSPRNCRIKTGMPTTQEGCMGEGHLPSPCGVLFGASPPSRCRRSRPVLRLAGYPAAIGASSPVAGGVASSSASLPRRRWEAPRR